MEREERPTALRSAKSCTKNDFWEDGFMQEKGKGNFAGEKVFAKLPSPFNLSVGVLIPARNEEKNIEDVICRLRNLGYENVLVVDGGSEDATLRTAEKNGAKVIPQVGFGKGNAMRQVLTKEYFDVDALVLMDADGSMAPEEIPVFIEALNSGADIVKGSRFLKGGNTYDMSLTRRIGNAFMMVGVNLLFSTRYTDLCYGFAVLNKRAIKELVPLLQSENFEIEAEIFIKAAEIGLNVREVPSIEFKRKYGSSNLNAVRDGLSIFTTIMREFFNY
ncbi:MAG: glycosyltransferase family 2 protein [Candidatus Bathyarchaeia archaeon]